MNGRLVYLPPVRGGGGGSGGHLVAVFNFNSYLKFFVAFFSRFLDSFLPTM
jgi:hypothetical protein